MTTSRSREKGGGKREKVREKVKRMRRERVKGEEESNYLNKEIYKWGGKGM